MMCLQLFSVTAFPGQVNSFYTQVILTERSINSNDL